MQRLPANNAFSLDENDPGRTHGSGSVSLRGFGPKATLVLINGRRVAPFGFAEPFGDGTFVDLNQIPVAAVERVEVLLDGASAVYGSDAIAGVINIMLRRDYRGAEVAASVGRSTHGDATQRQAHVTLGFGDLPVDGYNIFANFSHRHQDPVETTARWHSRTSDYRGFGLADFRSQFAYPGNLYTANNQTFLQPLSGCMPLFEPGSPNAGRCLYELVRDIVSETQRDTLLVAGTATLPHGFELFGDVMIGRTFVRGRNVNHSSGSYSANGSLPVGVFLLPVGHPQNPYPFEVNLRTRFVDERRVLTPTSDTQRVVAGARHRDLSGWDVEAGLLWSRSKIRSTIRGVIDESVLRNEVFDAAGRAVSGFRFGDPAANDPSLMARLYPELVEVGTTSTASLDVRGAREVFRLPGGPLQLAIGGELRRERFSTATDRRIASGDVSVLFGLTAAGTRTISSGYAELSLPLTRSLEANIAERYDHYSDFGGTTNSKAGIKWRVTPRTAVRATFATAFRAPSPVETGQAPSHFFSVLSDPKLCPVPDVNNPNCELRVRVDTTANPALQPERAYTATVGIVVEPWQGSSFTVDAFRIRRRDEIGGDTRYLLAHEDQFPGAVVRNADGTINRLNVRSINIGSSRTWGIDASARAKTALGALGQLGIDGSYAWLPHFWIAPTPDAPLSDYAGVSLRPKVRARLSFSLDQGPWRSALTFNYTGKYLRAVSPADLGCPFAAAGTDRPELCSVKAWRTTDLFIGYTGVKKLELGLLISNIDNVQAPLAANAVQNNWLAYSPAFHSAVGRFFKLSAKYSFQ
jgi:iron complex outermembrane receptor protein